MNWQLIIGSGGLVGIAVMFFYVIRFFIRMENRINNIETNLNYKIQLIQESVRLSKESIELKLSFMANDIIAMKKIVDEMRADLRNMETKIEERTLKVIYTTQPLPLGDKFVVH